MFDLTTPRNQIDTHAPAPSSPSSHWTSWLARAIFPATEEASKDDDKEGTAVSPRPTRSLRRQVTQRIQLTRRGHLVLESRVADRLLEAIPMNTQPEFKTMRYTAVCCAPDDFASHGYTLRQHLSHRSTELMIVITLYNVSSQKPSTQTNRWKTLIVKTPRKTTRCLQGRYMGS